MYRADIRLKRIRDPAEAGDGYRVLVDRVWPRGVAKAQAAVDEWAKELAPSRELRQWFAHEPERWEGFRERYRHELAEVPQPLRRLVERCAAGPVTLLFDARDREHNQAVVLREVLAEELEAWYGAGEPASPVCYARHEGGEEPG
ncbi:DUF488 domain-containing protein [Arhodomonas sp. SL1]|uniref:DUF488 domain-containing protein n=1 Tax=Arhodomonas sp. SL1 TaxID=3425691 RepID=UPI003F8848DE